MIVLVSLRWIYHLQLESNYLIILIYDFTDKMLISLTYLNVNKLTNLFFNVSSLLSVLRIKMQTISQSEINPQIQNDR